MLNMEKSHILALAALIGLTACGGGGGGGGGNADPTPEPPGLFFGTTDPAASGNGADFASGNGNASDLDGQTYNVRIVRTTGDTASGQISQEINEGVMVRIDAANYGLNANGETLTFVNGFANNGTIQGFARPNLPSNHAAVYRLLSGAALSGQGTKSDIAYFVIGAETNPETIETLPGSVSYEGSFEAVGVRADDLPRGIPATGNIELTADFGSNTVAGNVFLTAEDVDYDLSLDPTAITGNGFAGDLTIADCSGVTCTSDSQIAGVFFGPNAEEIAGITQLDLSSTDAEGNTSFFTGSGGFTSAAE